MTTVITSSSRPAPLDALSGFEAFGSDGPGLYWSRMGRDAYWLDNGYIPPGELPSMLADPAGRFRSWERLEAMPPFAGASRWELTLAGTDGTPSCVWLVANEASIAAVVDRLIDGSDEADEDVDTLSAEVGLLLRHHTPAIVEGLAVFAGELEPFDLTDRLYEPAHDGLFKALAPRFKDLVELVEKVAVIVEDCSYEDIDLDVEDLAEVVAYMAAHT